MNTIHAGRMATTLLVAGTIFAGGAAYAEDFPRTVAAAHLSMTRGFSQAALPLLNRGGVRDADSTSTSLMAALCAEPCTSVSTSRVGDAIRLTTDRWSLDITGDGTAARFRDAAVEGRAHSLAKDVSQRLSAAALEKAGREFIASSLGSAIVLGQGEEMVPVRTDYRIEGGQDLKTGETTQSVVANRIVFGRTLGGVPVVGGGSTVVVTFANDGSVESFQYDWPSYGKTDAQALSDNEEVFQRLQTVIGARTGVTAANFRVKPPSREEAANPVKLTSDTTLQKLECGYYDPGVATRDASAPVQSGCVYHAVLQDQQGIRRGFAGAVPAGTTIAPDTAWREAIILTHGTPAQSPIVPGKSQ